MSHYNAYIKVNIMSTVIFDAQTPKAIKFKQGCFGLDLFRLVLVNLVIIMTWHSLGCIHNIESRADEVSVYHRNMRYTLNILLKIRKYI